MIGKIICELQPGKNNERNSEGAFLELKDGSILFIYSHYRASGLGDHCDADLYGILSKDNGESFGEPFPVLIKEDYKADNLMSVSLMRMQNGDIGLFYLQKNNTQDGGVNLCIPYLVRSKDEGKTWSAPVRCVAEDGYFVLNNDRPLRTKSGRILVPLAKHDPVSYMSTLYFFASDDDGKSFKPTQKDIPLPVSAFDDAWLSVAQEPGLAQFENGTIWCFIRTVLGRQYEMFSTDDGKTFSVPNPSRFTSPHSPMCVKTLKNGKHLVVWNPVPLYNGRSEKAGEIWTGGRTPLVFTLLDPDGTCDHPVPFTEIESDENRGYCYTAIYELKNGDVLLGYCAGHLNNHCLSAIRIRKILKNELK